MSDRIPDPYSGKGLNEAAAADLDEDELGGTGGSSGGGTRQGKGAISGGTTDREERLPAGTAHGIAAEAAALGNPEGGFAMMGQRSNAGAEPTGAETVGAGGSRGEPGSGTPADSGEVGGAGSGTGPEGAASPGGRGR